MQLTLLVVVAGTILFVWYNDLALGSIAKILLVRRDVLRAVRIARAKKLASSRVYWQRRLTPQPTDLVPVVDPGPQLISSWLLKKNQEAAEVRNGQ
jgi:hypothetical protein